MIHGRIALVGILLASSGACALQPTQVTVIIDTNAPADRTLDLSATVASGASSSPAGHTWVRGPTVPGSVQFPASFAIVPTHASQQTASVTLVLHAHIEATQTAPAIDFDRTARFAFTPHQSTVVRIFLPVECGAAIRGCTMVPDTECTVSEFCRELQQTCSDQASCTDASVTPSAHDDGGLTPMRPDIVHSDAPVEASASDAPDAPGDTAHTDAASDACPETGVCMPGATRHVSCGNCGTRIDTCSSSCAWATGACMGSGPCAPGDHRTVSCGPCANETDTCSSSCAWVTGSCSGSCCTPHAGCVSGNPIGGTCSGDGNDGCGGPCTCDSANGEACNVGSGYGSCCHTHGWFCADMSQCCPGTTCISNICN